MTTEGSDGMVGGAVSSRAGASAPPSRSENLQLMVFRLAGQRYGLAAADVLEVQRMVAVVPLPGAPDIVEGVIDLRGSLVPVVDVRQRFDLAPKPIETADHLVVAHAGPRKVALRVDAVLGLVDVADDALDTAVAELPGVEHVEGVAHDDEGLILVHDLARFLSLEEGQDLDGASAGSGGT